MAFSFKPTIWSAELLDNLYKQYVFGAAAVNRDYEGDAQLGSTVKITSVTDVSVSSYSVGGTLTYGEVDTTDQSLAIDQAKSFSKKLDDLNKAAAGGNDGEIMAKVMKSAAEALADAVDAYIASLYSGVDSSNVITAVDASTTAKNVYDKALVPMRVALSKANVPFEGRYAVVGSDVYGLLLQDDRFIDLSKSGEPALANGLVGRAAGFDIYESNNVTSSGAKHSSILAGYPGAITLAEQVEEMEAFRLQTTFADAVRGLLVYGAKLTRPKGVATCDITYAA